MCVSVSRHSCVSILPLTPRQPPTSTVTVSLYPACHPSIHPPPALPPSSQPPSPLGCGLRAPGAAPSAPGGAPGTPGGRVGPPRGPPLTSPLDPKFPKFLQLTLNIPSISPSFIKTRKSAPLAFIGSPTRKPHSNPFFPVSVENLHTSPSGTSPTPEPFAPSLPHKQDFSLPADRKAELNVGTPNLGISTASLIFPFQETAGWERPHLRLRFAAKPSRGLRGFFSQLPGRVGHRPLLEGVLQF